MLRPLALVALQAAVQTAFLWGETGCADEDRSALGVLREGYLANRESFPFIDCRFQFVRTEARTISDCLAGRFIGKRVIQRGHWLVNGPEQRYELVCEAAVTKAMEKRLEEEAKKRRGARSDRAGISVPLECADHLYLTSRDSYSMSYGPLLSGANIFPKGVEDGWGIRITPFSMDAMGPNESANPARYLKDCLDGRFVGRYLGTQQVNGVAVMMAAVGTSKEIMAETFGFDPARGFLPVYFSRRDPKTGKRHSEVHVTNAKRCSQNRWFPMRSVVVNDPDSKAPFKVEEIAVTHLDVDAEPARERFFLDLPAGAQVNVPGEPAWRNLRKPERVNARDIARVYNECVEAGKAYAAKVGNAEAGKGRARSFTGISWTALGLTLSIVVFFISLGLFAFLRRTRRNAQWFTQNRD